MKKQTQPRSLKLDRETLRVLDHAKLDLVAGGKMATYQSDYETCRNCPPPP